MRSVVSCFHYLSLAQSQWQPFSTPGIKLGDNTVSDVSFTYQWMNASWLPGTGSIALFVDIRSAKPNLCVCVPLRPSCKDRSPPSELVFVRFIISVKWLLSWQEAQGFLTWGSADPKWSISSGTLWMSIFFFFKLLSPIFTWSVAFLQLEMQVSNHGTHDFNTSMNHGYHITLPLLQRLSYPGRVLGFQHESSY